MQGDFEIQMRHIHHHNLRLRDLQMPDLTNNNQQLRLRDFSEPSERPLGSERVPEIVPS